MSGDPRHRQRDQRDDAEHVRLAESAVLEDAESGEAGDGGRDDVDDTDAVARRDRAVAQQCRRSGNHCDQADRSMSDTKRSETEHARLLKAVVDAQVGSPAGARNRIQHDMFPRDTCVTPTQVGARCPQPRRMRREGVFFSDDRGRDPVRRVAASR
jgi:hypothetical protein